MIISINNHKGGTGKSQTALHLAEALARKLRTKSVLVVDNDPQGDSSRKLLAEDDRAEPGLFEVYSAAVDNEPLEMAASELFHTSKVHKNLYVCPNHEYTAGLEIPLIRQLDDDTCFTVLQRFLDAHSERFDYIIIDNPPSWSAFVYNSLAAADCCVVPVLGASVDSLNGIRRTFDMIRKIKASVNPKLRFLRALVNNIDRRTSLGRGFYEHLVEAMGQDRVFETAIPISADIQKAESEKSTVFARYPNSGAAKAFRNLAEEVESIRASEAAQHLLPDINANAQADVKA